MKKKQEDQTLLTRHNYFLVYDARKDAYFLFDSTTGELIEDKIPAEAIDQFIYQLTKKPFELTGYEKATANA